VFKSENAKFSRQGQALPVELFQADDEYYVFDVNKVVFFEVSKIIFEVLSTLKSNIIDINNIFSLLPGYSFREIEDALSEIESFRSEGYFKPMEFQRLNPYILSDIKDNLSNKLKGIFFYINTKCNLSCSYCILSGDYQNHTGLKQEEMTWDTAQKAIDFFLSRARRDGCFRIDFIGGEPLLSFPLIKRIVSNIKEKLLQRNQKIMISITSNGTIINEEIVDFLIENDVLLQFSIDGTKKIHDAYRKFRGSNVGSFETILKNLQFISTRNSDYFSNNLRLKAVITTESLDISDMDFFNIPLINTLIEKIRFTMVNKYPHYNLEKDQDYFMRIQKLAEILLQKKDVSNIAELLDGLTFKSKNLYYSTFNNFFDIQVVNYLHYDIGQPIPFSKNCLIGMEGAVNPDGSISICYNADTFIIGNVIEDTWYFDKIAEYENRRYTLTNCKHCFVKRFCNLCYEKLNDTEDNFDIQIQNFCQFTRYYFRTIFEYMLKIMARNPKLWNELQKMAEESKNDFLGEQSKK